MPPTQPHLIVREGPEKGREIVVPGSGARVGRASENDLVLNDAALSRFQCRLFFKDSMLHVLDLGSTNQTLVNHKPASEQPLFPGDEILIGEMTLRVLSHRLDGVPPPPTPAPAPVPRPATVTVLKPAAPPATREASLHDTSVDLGFRKPKEGEEGGSAAGDAPRRHAPSWLWALAVASLLALGIAAIIKFTNQDSGRPPPAAKAEAPEKALALRVEKVEANAQNIFRYLMTLEDGRIYVEIDDLRADRKVSKEKKVAPAVLADLAETLRKEDFFGLNPNYEGLSPDFHDHKQIQVTLGRQTKAVRVFNRIEPEAFKSVRTTIEAFAESELGLEALSLPPEELKKRGENAYLLGKKLYDERNTPKHDNLWNAIKAFTEVGIFLESVEPKPDYYADAVGLLDASKQEMRQRIQDLDFRAQQNRKLREWEEAARTLRIIMQTIPDRTDDRHAKAEKDLLSVERNLGPNR